MPVSNLSEVDGKSAISDGEGTDGEDFDRGLIAKMNTRGFKALK
jgi:hypothetical protein